jgi:hypothetical protein
MSFFCNFSAILLLLGCLFALAQTARPLQQFMLLASDKSSKPDAKPKPGVGSAVIGRWRNQSRTLQIVAYICMDHCAQKFKNHFFF